MSDSCRIPNSVWLEQHFSTFEVLWTNVTFYLKKYMLIGQSTFSISLKYRIPFNHYIFYNQTRILSSIECSDGQYGYNCVGNCSMTCRDSVKCDKITGHCIGGCQAGWMGDMCKKGKNKLLIKQCISWNVRYIIQNR